MVFAQMWKTWKRRSAAFADRQLLHRKPRQKLRLVLELLEDRTLLTSWAPVGPAPITGISDGGNVTGRVTAIAADPNPSDTNGNTVYIGTPGGGVWKGQQVNTSNPTWTPLTNNLAAQTGDPLINLNVGAIATAWDSTTDQTIIYAGLGEANAESNLMVPTAAASQFYGTGLIMSADGGNTWTLLGGPTSSNVFYQSAISKIVVPDATADPFNIYVAASTAKNGVVGNEGIWHCADTETGQSAANWVNTTATTATQTGIPGSTVDMFSDLVAIPNTQVLYAAIGEATGSADNGVWMTTNGGTTWTEMTGTTQLPMPSGEGAGRISLALSGNVGSANSPQYELWAAFIMDNLTQTANITGYSQSGTTLTLHFSDFTGLQPFRDDETLSISGLPSGLNGDWPVIDVNTETGTMTLTVSSSTTIPETSASGTITSEIGALYQLGFVDVSGQSSDATEAFNVPSRFDLHTPNGFPDSTTDPQNDNKYNYVGNQGYYDTALTVNPDTTTPGQVQVFAGGQNFLVQIDDADSASQYSVNALAGVNAVYGPSIHTDHHALLLDPAGNSSYTLLDGSDGGVWSFNPNATQASAAWTNLNTNLQLGQFYGIAVNPTNTSQIYGGVQDNGNSVTLNTGATSWQAVSNDDGSQVYIDPTLNSDGNETVYYSDGATVYKSNSNANPFSPTVSSSDFSPTLQPAGDAGANSAGVGDFPGVTYLMERVNGSDYLWYGGSDTENNASLWMSDDGGSTPWVLIGGPTTAGHTGNPGWVSTTRAYQNGFAVEGTPVDSIGVDPSDPGIIYVGLRGGYLLTTKNGVTADGAPNGSASWTAPTTPPVALTTAIAQVAGSSPVPIPQTINVNSTAGFPNAGQLFVTTASGTVVVLTYTGTTATSFTGVAGGDGYTLTNGAVITYQNDLRISDILVVPNTKSQVAFASYANFGNLTGGSQVFMTTNGGAAWTSISGTSGSGQLPDVPVWSIVQGNVNGQPTLFVGTDTGVYAAAIPPVGSTSWSWSRFGAGLPNVQVRSMSLVEAPNPLNPSQSESVLAVGTWGQGAYEISFPGSTVPPPSPPAPPSPTAPPSAPASGSVPSVFAQAALSNLSAGSSAATQNYQSLGTLDSFAASFFAAQAQNFANLAFNTPQTSALAGYLASWNWYVADFSASYSLQFSYLSYFLSHSQSAAAAASFEYVGLVNGLFAVLFP